jgi:CIC family chloride channel protein
MSRVLSGESQFTLLALFVIGVAKWALTPVSVAGGFPGGNFAPVLFVGTMLGGAFGDLIQSTFFQTISSNAQSFAIAGMAAMLAGVMRAPITAIMLVFEITNDYRLILPIMLASVVCVLISERLMPEGMGLYTFGLMRLGIRLQQGRDIDVMQGIMVREAMTTPAPTIPESATLDTLRDAFRQHQTRSLCVVDLRGELVGIVTLSDLQRAYDQISQQKGSSILTVGDICTRDVVTASPDDVLWTAIRLMGARDIGRLPVIKPNTRELLGILRRHNIVTAYALAITRKQRTQQHQEIIRLKALTGAHVFEMHLEPGSPVVGKRISEVKWPLESIVASIQRRNKLIVPHGNTVLQAGDILTIVADERAEEELVAALGI